MSPSCEPWAAPPPTVRFQPTALKATETALFQRASYMEPRVCTRRPPPGMAHPHRSHWPEAPTTSPLPCLPPAGSPVASTQGFAASPAHTTVFRQHPHPSPCLPSAPLRFLCRTAPEGPFSPADRPGHLPGPEHCCGLAWAPEHLQPCLPCVLRHSLEIPMVDFQKDVTLLAFGPSV